MASPIFGVIPTGSPIIIEPTTVPSPTSFVYSLPSKGFHHIVVFLLPGIELPPGTAASVYMAVGAAPTVNDLKFLGGIGPGKESAIFKVNGGGVANGTGGADVNMDAAQPVAAAGEIILGISLESADDVTAKMAALNANNGNSANSDGNTSLVLAGRRPAPATTVVLAQRIIKNAFNFLASFAGNVPVPGGSGTAGVEVVPLKAFQEWWVKFENRVKNDPSFLERDVD
eukprot:GHVU01231361.1.p1 GENE.GHVU01231361.1~~GHVU01231361.1.p1  ORF type:complete len:228 (+),score=36.53 GHVU01231361.1:207-890(+)